MVMVEMVRVMGMEMARGDYSQIVMGMEMAMVMILHWYGDGDSER